jgi:chorismate--pyruvate lyase
MKNSNKAAWRAMPPPPAHPLHGWLTSRGSLTARIIARCRDFRLTRLVQQVRSGNRDELPELDLRLKEQVLVREVILWSGEMPLVFAHSLAARRDLNGAWRDLRTLGTRPLAAMLFADPRVRRLAVEYRRLDRRHALYRRARELFTTSSLPHTLWARRSVFLRKGRPLLVTEVFLPGILTLAK